MLFRRKKSCYFQYCPTVNHFSSSVIHGSVVSVSWWRHQMEPFSALLAICAGNSPVPGEFPAQRPVTHSFDVFFDLRLNKRLSKQSWGWWFETLSRPLWRHRNVWQTCDYWALRSMLLYRNVTSLFVTCIMYTHLRLNMSQYCMRFCLVSSVIKPLYVTSSPVQRQYVLALCADKALLRAMYGSRLYKCSHVKHGFVITCSDITHIK